MEWTYDGHPIMAGASRRDFALTGERAHYSIAGTREMVVVARYYTDQPENRSKRFVEYTCRDLQTGELYPYARLLAPMSGLDDGDDNVLRPASSILPTATGVTGSLVNEQTRALDTDGDQVLVGFIEGSRSRPVIVGVFRHSDSQYGATSTDGERRLMQHKGTKVEISSSGEYTITHKSGAYVRFLDDGSIEVVPASGKEIRVGDADLVSPFDGVVTGRGQDPFTGATYAALNNASTTVLGKK